MKLTSLSFALFLFCTLAPSYFAHPTEGDRYYHPGVGYVRRTKKTQEESAQKKKSELYDEIRSGREPGPSRGNDGQAYDDQDDRQDVREEHPARNYRRPETRRRDRYEEDSPRPETRRRERYEEERPRPEPRYRERYEEESPRPARRPLRQKASRKQDEDGLSSGAFAGGFARASGGTAMSAGYAKSTGANSQAMGFGKAFSGKNPFSENEANDEGSRRISCPPQTRPVPSLVGPFQWVITCKPIKSYSNRRRCQQTLEDGTIHLTDTETKKSSSSSSFRKSSPSPSPSQSLSLISSRPKSPSKFVSYGKDMLHHQESGSFAGTFWSPRGLRPGAASFGYDPNSDYVILKR